MFEGISKGGIELKIRLSTLPPVAQDCKYKSKEVVILGSI